MLPVLQTIATLSMFMLVAGCGEGWFGSKKAAPAAPTLKVVNVLDASYHNDAHIKGSLNIEFSKLDEAVRDWDKNTPVVLYCANYQCSASGEAARKLKKMGFTNVMAYEGGTAEWYQLREKDGSYEIEGPAVQEYLKQVVAAPAEHATDIQIITAAELKDLIRKASEAAPQKAHCAGC